MLAQPKMALSERLWVGANRLDTFQRVLQSQQVVLHKEAGLTDDEQWSGEKKIK